MFTTIFCVFVVAAIIAGSVFSFYIENVGSETKDGENKDDNKNDNEKES